MLEKSRDLTQVFFYHVNMISYQSGDSIHSRDFDNGESDWGVSPDCRRIFL